MATTKETDAVAQSLASIETATAASELAEHLTLLHSLLVGDDAEASLAAFRGANGFAVVTKAVGVFQWDEAAQLPSINIITAYAAHSQAAAVAEGAVETVVRAMEATPESLPCTSAGLRALLVLTGNSRDGLVHAKLAGAEDAVQAARDMFSHDGEVQYRAEQLRALLASVTEAEAEAEAPATTSASTSRWAALKAAVNAGRAAELARGSLPGFSGVSGAAAACAQEGPASVVAFVQEAVDNEERAQWGMDALATCVEGNGAASTEAVDAGGAALVAAVLRAHVWSERTVSAALRAARASLPWSAEACTGAEVVEAAVDAMRASANSCPVQREGVLLLQALTRAHPPALRRVMEAGGVHAVRAAVDSNPEDGQLQWRGMNLLDALKPGQGEEVRQRALERSFSSFLRRKDSKAQMGGSFSEKSPAVPATSAAALKDVEQMAQVVEVDEDDDE